MSPEINLVGIQITEQEKKNSLECVIGKQDNEELIELSNWTMKCVGSKVCDMSP